MFASSSRFAAVVAVVALAACSGQSSVPTASPAFAPTFVAAAKTKVTATPTKLNFTTVPSLKLTISEKNYKGKFTVSVSPAGIVALKPATGKGPSLKVTVTAKNAGTAKLTAKDASGNSVSVPVTVTQGVIIIQ